ncbi:MAG TPA: GspH/FimT family pseudopilin [Halomonas sp.]|nr:GspH/FimT family pseudopilin [Halomonas sp.]
MFDAPASKCGFTLIELLVTIAVLAIVLSIAVPSFQDMARRNRLTSETNNLVSALAIARSEAIKRGSVVTVCKTSNPDAATPTCASGASWADGWIVFTDTGTRGTVDGTDVRLKIQQPAGTNGPTVTPSASFANFVSYAAAGAAVASNSIRDLPTTGSFTVCINSVSRLVDVGLSGRVSTTVGVCP